MNNLHATNNQIYAFSILIVITLLIYFPVFSNGFVDSWDDQWMVVNTYTESGWTFENLYSVFTQSYYGQYSPIVEMNFMLLYSLFGYNPWAFHLMSLIWHIACIALVYKWICILLMYGNLNEKQIRKIAFMTSLIFAVHPVNVEAVAWASAIKVPIYTFFYLITLIFYLKYIRTEKIGQLVIALLCFILSCLSKEQGFVLPAVLILMDWFVGRNLRKVDIWLEKIPFLILSVGFGLLTLGLQGERSEAVSYTFGQRLLFGSYSLFEYITKSFFPVNLNYLYPFPIPEGSTDLPFRFFVYPILFIVLIGWLYSQRKNKLLFFCCLFFLINLILSLHIVSIPRIGIVADRYLYLSLVGLQLILSYNWVILKEKWNTSSIRILFLAIFLISYLFYLGNYTYQYSKKWENTVTMKEYLRSFL